jgi:hypothetical protein
MIDCQPPYNPGGVICYIIYYLQTNLPFFLTLVPN